jgi:hypothetical protein
VEIIDTIDSNALIYGMLETKNHHIYCMDEEF